MKIEILTQEMAKKPEILTLLANQPNVQARGSVVELPDLKLEIGDNYLLFIIRSWQEAEQLVPRLFYIRPNAYSPNYFEPFSEQKILITAQAKSILEIIPEMSAIEHLNLEQGELAGTFEIKWPARDVTVVARCYLMIEGEIAVCKVKFETLNRETEYQCKDCIESINFQEVLKVFAGELLDMPLGPVINGPVVEAKGTIEPQKWSEFINHCNTGMNKSRIDFDSNTNEIKLVYSEYDYLSFREQGGQRNFTLHFTTPGLLTSEFIESLYEKLDVTGLEIRAKMENATFDLNELVEKMGFQKDCEFFNFVSNNDFTATYNVKTRVLFIETKIPYENDNFIKNIENTYVKMQNFLNQVNNCVV